MFDPNGYAMLNSPSPRTLGRGWLLLTIVLASSGACWSVTLRAAVAKVDITPAPGAHLWGYSNRHGLATGTLDSLYARVLILEAGKQSLALVDVDLGRPF